MSELVKSLKRFVVFDDYIKDFESYRHLFEIQLPPTDLLNFRPKHNFEQGGTLLVGDLVLNTEEEEYLESHPFPEWVVQLISSAEPSGKAYLIVPDFEGRFIFRLDKMNYEKRIKKIEEKIGALSIDDLIAVEYKIGMNIRVPENVPHTFISKINNEIRENPPYLQVFEPNLKVFHEVLKFKTPYYKLPFKIKI